MKHLILFLALISGATGLFAQSGTIDLPDPQKENGMPLMQALNERMSIRKYSEKALSKQELSNLLWAAFGINRENGKRTAPSSRNKQEMEIWAALESGLYRYDPEAHQLELKIAKDLRAVTGKQRFAAKVPLNLIFVANYDKAGNTSAEEYRCTSNVNTGYISQNVYLYCASAGLATVARGWYNQEKLEEAMQLPDHKEVILTQSVGSPKE